MSPIAPNRLGTPSRPLAALLMRHPPCPLAPRTSRFHGADGPYTGSAGRARAGIRNFPKKSRHLFARLSAGGNWIRTIGPAPARLFWALPIGDGGTKGGATYRFRSETAMLTWSGSRRLSLRGGTASSNPLCSSGESRANLTFGSGAERYVGHAIDRSDFERRLRVVPDSRGHVLCRRGAPGCAWYTAPRSRPASPSVASSGSRRLQPVRSLCRSYYYVHDCTQQGGRGRAKEHNTD